MHEYRTNRAYRALLNNAIANGIGSSLFNIVFIIYASTMPFKTLAVSLASMATFIPAILSLLTGYWADRAHQHTRAMIVTRLTQTLLFVGLSLLILLPGNMCVLNSAAH